MAARQVRESRSGILVHIRKNRRSGKSWATPGGTGGRRGLGLGPHQEEQEAAEVLVLVHTRRNRRPRRFRSVAVRTASWFMRMRSSGKVLSVQGKILD